MMASWELSCKVNTLHPPWVVAACRKKISPAANLLAVSKEATGLLYSVPNPYSSSTKGFVRLSMFSMRTYVPRSMARMFCLLRQVVEWFIITQAKAFAVRISASLK
jgi:hypothetical protein